MKKPNLFSLLLITIMSIYTWQSKAACRVDTVYRYSFDTLTQVKSLTSRYVYTYTAFDSVSNFALDNWDAAASKWDGVLKRTYNYNGQNLLKEDIALSWDAASSSFIPYSQEIFTYDASNKLTGSTTNFWEPSTSTWRNGYIKTNSYNGQGKLIESVEEIWNSTTSVWRNYLQFTYTYNANGNIDSTYRNGWDAASSKWYNYYLFLNKYNATNQLIEDYWFEYFGAVWINKQLNEYSYNLDGTPKKTTYREWDDMAGVYVRGEDVIYNYNANGDLIGRDIYNDWRADENKHKQHGKEEYICAKTGVGIQSLSSASAFSVYPNPITQQGQFTILAEKESAFQIYSIDGKEVQQGTLRVGENKIDIPNLSIGIYLLKVADYSKKLVVQ